jgi:hypothetical protein
MAGMEERKGIHAVTGIIALFGWLASAGACAIVVHAIVPAFLRNLKGEVVLPFVTTMFLDAAEGLRSGPGIAASSLAVLAWTVLGLVFRRREGVLAANIVLSTFLFSVAWMFLGALYLALFLASR